MAEQVRASFRPTVIGRQHAVASGHYLATTAAMRVLDAGGNAVDAGVTAAMALAILQPDIVSFAGVAPTLIYRSNERRVEALSGVGHWPAAVDVERLRAEGDGNVPVGILRTVVPVAPAVHIEALRRHGTISFADAAGPAMELAREGFAMYPMLRHTIEQAAKYQQFPENARVFRPGGRTPALGERFVQADLGRTIASMIDAERHARGDRDAKLRAAHDYFYRGPIAEAIDAYHVAHGGFLRKSDLASYEAKAEDSLSCQYRGLTVHACDTWCQGIVLLEALKILERTRLESMEHNGPAYVHAIAEALNLAFADREAYVGDPAFVRVPTRGLLSDAYAASQQARIDAGRAFGAMPAAGDPWPDQGEPAQTAGRSAARAASGPVPAPLDTIYACVVDRWGNAYSVTP